MEAGVVVMEARVVVVEAQVVVVEARMVVMMCVEEVHILIIMQQLMVTYLFVI